MQSATPKSNITKANFGKDGRFLRAANGWVLCQVRKAKTSKSTCPHFSYYFCILIVLLGQPFVSLPSGLIIRRCRCNSYFSFFFFFLLSLHQLSPGLLLVFLGHQQANWPSFPTHRPIMSRRNQQHTSFSTPDLSVTLQMPSSITQEQNKQIFEITRQKTEEERAATVRKFDLELG